MVRAVAVAQALVSSPSLVPPVSYSDAPLSQIKQQRYDVALERQSRLLAAAKDMQLPGNPLDQVSFLPPLSIVCPFSLHFGVSSLPSSTWICSLTSSVSTSTPEVDEISHSSMLLVRTLPPSATMSPARDLLRFVFSIYRCPCLGCPPPSLLPTSGHS